MYREGIDQSPYFSQPLPPETMMTTTKSTTAITTLTAQLTISLRRPTRRTLTLIEKAYLSPFESQLARTASAAERHDLLELLYAHRMVLAPYLDTDSIARNLHRQYG